MSAYTVDIAVDRLVTLNAQRRMHPFERARIDKEQREASCWTAKTSPSATPCNSAVVGVVIHQKRGPLADAGNHYPTVKAVIDGLVDARLLPDDTPPHLRALRMGAPQKCDCETRRNHLLVTVDDATGMVQ